MEGSFNVMDDITRKDRSNLTTENHECCSFVKGVLKSKGFRAANMVMGRQVTTSKARYGMFLSAKAKQRTAEKEKRFVADSNQEML